MNYAGLIGIALALGLAGALIVAVFGLAYWNRPLAEPGAEIISVVVGGMVGALSAVIARLFGGPK